MKTGIYIHLPFCRVRCSYCDFPLTTRLSLSDRYYSALLKEIRMRDLQETSDTLYFGGGTPSLTPAPVLKQIISEFSLEESAEITLEANPDDVASRNLDEWKSLGITRLSIGIQSLEETVLKPMLRTHSPDAALKALPAARNAGFESINADLMLGSPGQTAEGFIEGLRMLLDFRPEHLSLYLLELHEKTALYRQWQIGKVSLMQEDQQIECYSSAVQMMKSAGYEHYEVSNFARPGYRSRHNLKYWSGAPYAGYGAGACSFLESNRMKNSPSVLRYIGSLEAGELPVEETIQEVPDVTTRNALIFGLRKTEGVGVMEFEKEYGISPLTLFGENAARFMEAGFLETTPSHLRLTLSGLLVSNEILSTLV